MKIKPHESYWTTLAIWPDGKTSDDHHHNEASANAVRDLLIEEGNDLGKPVKVLVIPPVCEIIHQNMDLIKTLHSDCLTPGSLKVFKDLTDAAITYIAGCRRLMSDEPISKAKQLIKELETK